MSVGANESVSMESATNLDQVQLLQSMPVFGGIRGDVLEFLLGLARRVTVRKGEYFYREGDPASSLFVLEDGAVSLLKHWRNNDYTLKSLDRGDCFGQVALIDLQPRNTSALGTTNSTAIELCAEDLYKLYKREVHQFTLIYMNMAREVCRRLREADERAFEADIQARRICKESQKDFRTS
jgi:CRP/FNR family cyclic AMP-dependent transcriptional regulator